MSVEVVVRTRGCRAGWARRRRSPARPRCRAASWGRLRRACRRSGSLPARPHDRRTARRHDGAGAAVVADGQVPPVRQQRLAGRAGRSGRRSRRGAPRHRSRRSRRPRTAGAALTSAIGIARARRTRRARELLRPGLAPRPPGQAARKAFEGRLRPTLGDRSRVAGRPPCRAVVRRPGARRRRPRTRRTAGGRARSRRQSSSRPRARRSSSGSPTCARAEGGEPPSGAGEVQLVARSPRVRRARADRAGRRPRRLRTAVEGLPGRDQQVEEAGGRRRRCGARRGAGPAVHLNGVSRSSAASIQAARRGRERVDLQAAGAVASAACSARRHLVRRREPGRLGGRPPGSRRRPARGRRAMPSSRAASTAATTRRAAPSGSAGSRSATSEALDARRAGCGRAPAGPATWPAPPVSTTESAGVGVLAQGRDDRCRGARSSRRGRRTLVPARLVGRSAGLVDQGVAGREDRGVVDETAQTRGSSRWRGRPLTRWLPNHGSDNGTRTFD